MCWPHWDNVAWAIPFFTCTWLGGMDVKIQGLPYDFFHRAFYLSQGIFFLGGKFWGGGRLKFFGRRYHFFFFLSFSTERSNCFPSFQFHGIYESNNHSFQGVMVYKKLVTHTPVWIKNGTALHFGSRMECTDIHVLTGKSGWSFSNDDLVGLFFNWTSNNIHNWTILGSFCWWLSLLLQLVVLWGNDDEQARSTGLLVLIDWKSNNPLPCLLFEQVQFEGKSFCALAETTGKNSLPRPQLWYYASEQKTSDGMMKIWWCIKTV